jgi:hypothetical protein
MARFLKINPTTIIDTTRIIGLRKDQSWLTGKALLYVQTYETYVHSSDSLNVAIAFDIQFMNSYVIRPNFKWSKISFATEDARDFCYDFLETYKPKNVDNALRVDDL